MIKRISALLLTFCVAGCSSNVSPPTPATMPVQSANSPQQRFDDPASGISFMYPSDWKPVPGTKSQLQVASPVGGIFTLDVPTLPFHIPGMIPIDQVTSGYVDDQKKKMPDATATPLPNPTLPDAKQQRVKITGHRDGKVAIDEAVLIVHNDKVYILAIDGDDKSYPPMHAAMDAVLRSLSWTNTK